MNETIKKVTLSTGVEVELKNEKTRKISREFNFKLYGDAEVDLKGQTTIKARNVEIANDYLIMALTGISQNDLDNLNDLDYNKVLELVNGFEKNEDEKKN